MPLQDLLTDVTSSMKADVSAVADIVNWSSENVNIKLGANITSSLTSQLISKFQAENQKLSEELTANFGQNSLYE
jgi:hypothetical protein